MKKFKFTIWVLATVCVSVLFCSCSDSPERYVICSTLDSGATELTDFQMMQIRAYADSLNPQKVPYEEAVIKISSFMVNRGLINHSITVNHLGVGEGKSEYDKDEYVYGYIAKFNLDPDEIRVLGGYYDTPYQKAIDSLEKKISHQESKIAELTSENQKLNSWLTMALTRKEESKTDDAEAEKTSDEGDATAAVALGLSTFNMMTKR